MFVLDYAELERYIVNANNKKIDLAMQFAFDYHEKQMYGDRPYYLHCVNIAARVFDNYGSENKIKLSDDTVVDLSVLICVAFLHDILEDTEVTYAQLEENFGELIANCVFYLTQLKYEPYRSYLNRIASNDIAAFVKKHDICENLMQSLAQQPYDERRTNKYAQAYTYLEEMT